MAGVGPAARTAEVILMSGLVERIGDAVGVPVSTSRTAGGQHGYQHLTGTLADGRSFFAKAVRPGGAGRPPRPEAAAAFTAEANGLRWLAAAPGGPPVPGVLGLTAEFLVIELIAVPQAAAPDAARRFGADLARMHMAGAPEFGAPWPGFIASLPLDNAPVAATAGGQWGTWYAQRRLVPYLRRARDDGVLARDQVLLVEAVISRIGELAGPPEPPARIHGDLWSGNLLWSGGRGWLIDPAAHGGHRETDLAMLALFGAPELTEIRRGYGDTFPLADSWRSRVALHQLHPQLVHVCLFGGGYRAQLAAAARAALSG